METVSKKAIEHSSKDSNGENMQTSKSLISTKLKQITLKSGANYIASKGIA